MATADTRAARERKQKIFVAVGGVVLLALLAIQLPKLLGGSGTETTAADTQTTITETTPAGETTPTPTTTTPPAGRTSVSLPDTDRPLALGPGQFRSFSAFTPKDPFVQQLASPDSPPAGSGDGGGGGGGSAGDKTKGPGTAPSQGFTTGGSQQAAVTVISVNGARQTLSAGSAFPARDPVFVLVAENVKTKTVVIGVVGGAYANGAPTTKLKIGKPLVLVNTTTGARYRLVLVSVGTGAAVPTAPASTPTAPTTP